MAREELRSTVRLPLPEVLKSLVEIEVGDCYFDLHNDYECCKLTYHADQRECTLFFKRLGPQGDTNYEFVNITFIGATIECYSFILNEGSMEDFKTLDSFYRGRFEDDNNKLSEFDSSDRALYYIGFYKGIELKIFASVLQIEF